MMTDALYGGVNAAVVTAMRDDLSIDLAMMEAHARWLLANGCNGLAILGTTGEANSLGVSERIAVMEGLTERGIDPSLMLPGTGTTAIPDTVLLTRRAEELGCRGALLLPPFFYKNPSEDGLFAYFSEVINRVGGDIRFYLYHFPAQSAVPFTLDLVGRLLKAFPGKVKGIKDSSGDFANTKGYADHFAKDGFEVYCGDDGALQSLLAAGGAGCITAAANVGCSVSARVYAAWDKAAGAEAQVQLAAIRKAVTSAPLIPALKALVARRTGEPAWNNIRPPHMRLSAEAANKLFAAFDACGLSLGEAASIAA
jgi:4-hydroxy-tetrahydrodipicolinate synthase